MFLVYNNRDLGVKHKWYAGHPEGVLRNTCRRCQPLEYVCVILDMLNLIFGFSFLWLHGTDIHTALPPVTGSPYSNPSKEMLKGKSPYEILNFYFQIYFFLEGIHKAPASQTCRRLSILFLRPYYFLATPDIAHLELGEGQGMLPGLIPHVPPLELELY